LCPFYSIVDYRDNRHLDDSTIVRFTIAIYRDNRQYRASLATTGVSEGPQRHIQRDAFPFTHVAQSLSLVPVDCGQRLDLGVA